MKRQDALKPHDIAVVIALAVNGDDPSMATFSEIGHTLGLSASTAHESVSRLQRAGLLRPGSRSPNLYELRNFLVHGVRAAFPPSLGQNARGVPTAYSGPPLTQLLDSTTVMVWPQPSGISKGISLTPLYPRAVELPHRAPRVYDALTLVDALRVGQARERKAAISALDKVFGVTSA